MREPRCVRDGIPAKVSNTVRDAKSAFGKHAGFLAEARMGVPNGLRMIRTIIMREPGKHSRILVQNGGPLFLSCQRNPAIHLPSSRAARGVGVSHATRQHEAKETALGTRPPEIGPSLKSPMIVGGTSEGDKR